jgi:hypothetical protein
MQTSNNSFQLVWIGEDAAIIHILKIRSVRDAPLRWKLDHVAGAGATISHYKWLRKRVKICIITCSNLGGCKKEYLHRGQTLAGQWDSPLSPKNGAQPHGSRDQSASLRLLSLL